MIKSKPIYLEEKKNSELWAVFSLLKKEIHRFGKVWVQTILAPVILHYSF